MKKLFSLVLITFMLFTVSCNASTLTAEQYANQLKNSGIPIENMIVYTAETDPNELLGRPNQYISKVNFDSGSIEVFNTYEEAVNRKNYIDTIGKMYSFLVEYSYIDGTVLFRLDKSLTPNQAEIYSQKFYEIIQ